MIQPQRGEIWSVNFAPAIGSEIKKVRPAVVINIPEAGRLPLSIVIPITDWKKQFDHFFWFVNIMPSKENGLSKESGADCFQIKSISKK
ncbi:PemK family transcriptional regulator [Candidatus Magnetomorum sp. HK-1]|nr:PemK family transcriptional regulator [Candidatus Magnetomorum sp. HK-1]